MRSRPRTVFASVGHSSGRLSHSRPPGRGEQWMHSFSFIETCGSNERFSGLQHHGQWKGQPLRKATVRMPPPSWSE